MAALSIYKQNPNAIIFPFHSLEAFRKVYERTYSLEGQIFALS
jgi:hypothetical protein